MHLLVDVLTVNMNSHLQRRLLVWDVGLMVFEFRIVHSMLECNVVGGSGEYRVPRMHRHYS